MRILRREGKRERGWGVNEHQAVGGGTGAQDEVRQIVVGGLYRGSQATVEILTFTLSEMGAIEGF